MFEHSIKVPRLYKIAARIAEDVAENGEGLKQLVYEKKHFNIKALYALVMETIQRKSQIDFLIKKSKLLEKEYRLDIWLARVLITELLWGKKKLPGESKPIKAILAYQQIFNAHSSDLHDIKTHANLKVRRPRFVRVNTLYVSVNEAIDRFRDEGWSLVRFPDANNYEGFLAKVANLEPEEFMIDIHVKDLLVFPHNTVFYRHEAYRSGSIILQDKASCMPVQLLNPPPGSTVLDMCAAPGNKTTQIAALMGNEGTIYAAEMDLKRMKILDKLVESSGATCIKTINRDVLTLNDSECPNVEYILVDPSCTGSGIVGRIDFGDDQEDMDENRFKKLNGFQILILKHALKSFPKAKRIVYSTCSIYPSENEEVVREVLESCQNYKLVPAKDLLPAPWFNFGAAEYGDIGSYCLYAKPETDFTIGFFIAVFERLKEGEVNPHFNSQKWKDDNKCNGDNVEVIANKKKKRKHTESNYDENGTEETHQPTANTEVIEEIESNTVAKKKKKKAYQEVDDNSANEVKAKKPKKYEISTEICDEPIYDENGTEKTHQLSTNTKVIEDMESNTVTKKKKKKAYQELDDISTKEVKAKKTKKYEITTEICAAVKSKNKKKKTKDSDLSENKEMPAIQTENSANEKQKKKKLADILENIEVDSNHINNEGKSKKKKRKKENKNVEIEEHTTDISQNKEKHMNDFANVAPKKKKKEKSAEILEENVDVESKSKRKREKGNKGVEIRDHAIEKKVKRSKKRKEEDTES